MCAAASASRCVNNLFITQPAKRVMLQVSIACALLTGVPAAACPATMRTAISRACCIPHGTAFANINHVECYQCLFGFACSVWATTLWAPPPSEAAGRSSNPAATNGWKVPAGFSSTKTSMLHTAKEREPPSTANGAPRSWQHRRPSRQL